MPELVPEGPRIPVHLMNEVDEGSVVFFCGAGVSVGDGSNLPNFEELVEHVYEANRIEADEVEHEALHRDEPDRRRYCVGQAAMGRRGAVRYPSRAVELAPGAAVDFPGRCR